MSKTKNSLFDRAFDKSARLQAGQVPNLTEAEDRILLATIKAYDARKQRALERFLQYLKKEGIDLPYLQAKLMFKQLWTEGKIT